MTTGSINQTVQFSASPKQVYDLLMNKKLYSEFTGGKVIVSDKVEGAFSVFDGYCTGYNIELVSGKKIIQKWNFKEDGWPNNHYSVCTFIFSKIANGCQLDFTQTDIPEHKIDDLSQGWKDYYWEPMKTYLATL
ncbi:MAG: SRPBCC family protein [Bacteroidia bacterium]